MQKVSIITLGCSKNLVDSERLARQFSAAGFAVSFDSDDHAEIVIINTCGFILDAKEESIAMILNAVNAKEQGSISELYVVGCLAERYADELRKEIPEVDSYFGVKDIYAVLQKLHVQAQTSIMNERLVSTPKHTAFLKIAEGCNRTCSFCAIPLIRGPHKSESLENLEQESRFLVQSGAKELSIISQDVSYYGIDIYGKNALPELLNKLLSIDALEWIRLHYLYPNNFPLAVLDMMQQSDRICNYLDMPIQHISDSVLGAMRRGFSSENTYALLSEIRSRVPDITLRTTLIVGHPGETDKDFEQLRSFVEEFKFERLGVFTYSHEENTYAAEKFEDSIPLKVKQERADELMLLQQDISLSKNSAMCGNVYKVLIDRIEGNVAVGRTQYDAYEVDNEVRISDSSLSVGEFYSVKITEADLYDISGVIV